MIERLIARSSADRKTSSTLQSDQARAAEIFAGDFQMTAIVGTLICINGE
jgi:hypothetical protein